MMPVILTFGCNHATHWGLAKSGEGPARLKSGIWQVHYVQKLRQWYSSDQRDTLPPTVWLSELSDPLSELSNRI